MYAQLGQIALISAALIALIQGLIGLWGVWKDNERSKTVVRAWTPIIALSVFFAFAMLTLAFIVSDFSISLVASHSHSEKPLLYKISGVWGNHEGSVLLWVLILSLFGALAARRSPETISENTHVLTLIIQGWLVAGFLGFIIFTSNPFALLPEPAAEGVGLNPLLQDPGLAIHPPLLYIGYVGLSLPFSAAIAALCVGKIDRGWAQWLRPWTLVTWSFLTLGITIGSLWAWYELGWGGWWVWDPVENVSFMPWLLATALLHSLMVMGRRGQMARWTVLLAIAAFSFSLIGTFVVRSGILLSVHSFAADPSRGVVILALLGVFTGAALLAYTLRAHKLAGTQNLPAMSKGGFLVINNILLIVATAIVFLGTFYPLFTDLISDTIVSVGEPYFNLVFVPVSVLLIIFMAAGPLLKWQGGAMRAFPKWILRAGLPLALLTIFLYFLASQWVYGLALTIVAVAIFAVITAFLRPGGKAIPLRHKPLSQWGFFLAHVGLLTTTLGIIWVSGWGTETRAVIQPGDTLELSGYSFTVNNLDGARTPLYMYIEADIDVEKSGQELKQLHTERRFYPARGMMTSEAGFRLSPINTIFVGLGDGNLDDGFILRAYYSPGVVWIWIGGLLMALGGFLSAADRRGRVSEEKKPS